MLSSEGDVCHICSKCVECLQNKHINSNSLEDKSVRKTKTRENDLSIRSLLSVIVKCDSVNDFLLSLRRR